MSNSQKIKNKKFTCSSCNESFLGKKIPVDSTGDLIDQDGIRGYSCSDCQTVFCSRCANAQIMHTFRPSPCPKCQTSFLKADFIYDEKPGLFQARALKKQVDADDGGGAEWYADSVVTLFADEVCILSKWQSNIIGQKAIVPLDKITGVELMAFFSENDLGILKFIPKAKGFLGQYFALLPKIRYNQEQEPDINELADRINQALKSDASNFQTLQKNREAEFFPKASTSHGAKKNNPGKSVLSMDDIAVLEKLAALHEKGILTDKEFATKKAQILDLY